MVNDLKLRGVQDILIAVVDGLKGFPEAINTVFPETTVQTCIVHLIRNSLDFASWKDRRQVAAGLKEVYRAPSAEAAAQALDAFDAGEWGRRYPMFASSLQADLRGRFFNQRIGNVAQRLFQQHRSITAVRLPWWPHFRGRERQ